MVARASKCQLESAHEPHPDLWKSFENRYYDEFICSQGAKTDHKDPDWNTILTAGSLRSRELKKPLGTVMEGDAKKRDEGIKVIKLMEKNLK